MKDFTAKRRVSVRMFLTFKGPEERSLQRPPEFSSLKELKNNGIILYDKLVSSQ